MCINDSLDGSEKDYEARISRLEIAKKRLELASLAEEEAQEQ